MCSAVSDFPALPKYTMKPAVLKRKRDKYPLENSPPLKRENRLSTVPTDQAGRTVARPHHNSHSKELHSPGQSSAKNPLQIRTREMSVSKVTCE